jgi:hypothetical protein
LPSRLPSRATANKVRALRTISLGRAIGKVERDYQRGQRERADFDQLENLINRLIIRIRAVRDEHADANHGQPEQHLPGEAQAFTLIDGNPAPARRATSGSPPSVESRNAAASCSPRRLTGCIGRLSPGTWRPNWRRSASRQPHAGCGAASSVRRATPPRLRRNAWAKPQIALICGDCREEMEAGEDAEGD